MIQGMYDGIEDRFCEGKLSFRDKRRLEKWRKIPQDFGVEAKAKIIDFTPLRFVRSIGLDCFQGCRKLVSFDSTCLQRVERIGFTFLSNTPNLRSVDFGGFASVTRIDARFLAESGITSVDCSPMKSLTSIGDSAFYLCVDLRSLNFSGLGKLKTVGCEFCCDCSSLKDADCSGLKSLKSIGESFFESCKRLAELDISGLNQKISKINGDFLWKCYQLSETFFLDRVDLSSLIHVRNKNIRLYSGSRRHLCISSDNWTERLREELRYQRRKITAYRSVTLVAYKSSSSSRIGQLLKKYWQLRRRVMFFLLPSVHFHRKYTAPVRLETFWDHYEDEEYEEEVEEEEEEGREEDYLEEECEQEQDFEEESEGGEEENEKDEKGRKEETSKDGEKGEEVQKLDKKKYLEEQQEQEHEKEEEKDEKSQVESDNLLKKKQKQDEKEEEEEEEEEEIDEEEEEEEEAVEEEEEEEEEEVEEEEEEEEAEEEEEDIFPVGEEESVASGKEIEWTDDLSELALFIKRVRDMFSAKENAEFDRDVRKQLGRVPPPFSVIRKHKNGRRVRRKMKWKRIKKARSMRAKALLKKKNKMQEEKEED